MSLAKEAQAQSEPQEADGHRLHWEYPRFRTSEYVGTALLSATGLFIEYGIGTYPETDWQVGLLFDEPVRNTLVAKTKEGRKRAADISDQLWPATQYFPVIDSIVTPLATDRFNTDVAWQMSMINWEVASVAFLLTRGAHRLIGRGRPSLQECPKNPDYDGYCYPESKGKTASFFSGHTSMSFAGAALTCSHHQALGLWGDKTADGLICGASLASATTIGVLRIVADKHWTTDVLTGAAIGLGVGFGVPYMLHYNHPRRNAAPSPDSGPRMMISPMMGESIAGASFSGVF